MEDNIRWKTTLDGRQPLMEDELDGRQPFTEEMLWWKTTIDERQPLMEDDLWCKMTFNEIWPLMEDNLQWKMTFDGRHLIERFWDSGLPFSVSIQLRFCMQQPPRLGTMYSYWGQIFPKLNTVDTSLVILVVVYVAVVVLTIVALHIVLCCWQ